MSPDIWSLLGAAALLVLNGALSLWLKLSLERRLLIAILRTTGQLFLLGLILRPIFQANDATWVALWATVMLAAAGWETTRRVSRRYRGDLLQNTASLALGAGVTSVLATGVFLHIDPWWSPSTFLPLLGMVLGNALTGVSLGLDRCLTEVHDSGGRVEAMLAFGASRWEASQPIARSALRVAMIPILNAMSAVGIVSIPGMMTGQLLAGADPQTAARYQILIMFLIAATVAISATGGILLCLRTLVDGELRLRRDRLR